MNDEKMQQLLPVFSELYNSEMNTVPQIRKKLNIKLTEYRKLRVEANKQGLIKLKPARRKKRVKRVKGKNYTHNKYYGNIVSYQIKHKGEYYCSVKTEEEAKEVVKRLKKCDWDKNKVKMIKEQVIKELKRS